jgi:hypothetical protein
MRPTPSQRPRRAAAWLEARGYRVVDMHVGEVEGELAKELDRLESALHERGLKPVIA